MSDDCPVPETRVLAVASHVVSGNVGNKIAVFALQSLGCDVAALNTVQFSNHTGYGQWKGSRVSADEITELYNGLKQSSLDDFDMMLSGYIPGATAVDAVGAIGKDLALRNQENPGHFFWVLDPVMGDNGRLYVAPEVVPAYKSIISHADLIVPNQFEAEQLSGVPITDFPSLKQAVEVLHTQYGVPHIIITSVSFNNPLSTTATSTGAPAPRNFCVIGSSRTSANKPRFFKIEFPAIDCYFSGTGDMFGALILVRIREAVAAVGPELQRTPSWLSGDEVSATELPLAKAIEKVVGSMHEVLTQTAGSMKVAIQKIEETTEQEKLTPAQLLVAKSKAVELRLVRNLGVLKRPNLLFKAVSL